MSLLRQMDVAVRGPASVLADDQVARIRLRWEREKRHRADKGAPAAPARRRKATDAPVAAPVAEAPAPAPVEEAPAKPVKAKATKAASKTKAAEEAAAPTVRRR